MKFLGEGEWKCKKHGSEYRRQWRKLHIAIEAETLQIRAVQLTTNNVSDSQVLEDLLSQVPLDEGPQQPRHRQDKQAGQREGCNTPVLPDERAGRRAG